MIVKEECGAVDIKEEYGLEEDPLGTKQGEGVGGTKGIYTDL